ncbi:MAG TPA: hypothetical protein DCM71_23630, partial [Runella sp.]|nr:hypothetical protein [Runella sp.]
FIEKRFAPFSRKKYSKFVDVWTEFMPEKIINPVHGVDEFTFDYILRHTLYRPRQILNHIYNIIKQWDESNTTNDKIHPNFIPKVVAKNNIIMATKVAEQLLVIYPNIISFLKSWQGSPTIIEARKCKEKIGKYFLNDHSVTDFSKIDKIFDELFDFGLFGIAVTNQTMPNNKRIEFKFAFVGDNINYLVHNFTGDNDLIAFSPMFREYCGCQASEYLIVPISLDNF